MRIAVLSDVHGNLSALEAVLEALKPYDAVWQLGDIVGYGPQPDEVVARLAEENATGVRGNHDSAAIGELETDAFNDDARVAVEWTAERIAPETRRWLAKLPLRMIDEPYTLVHGSPRDPTWEYVFSASIARANLAAFRYPALPGWPHPRADRFSGTQDGRRGGGHRQAGFTDEARRSADDREPGQRRPAPRRRSASQRDAPRHREEHLGVAPRRVPNRADAEAHGKAGPARRVWSRACNSACDGSRPDVDEAMAARPQAGRPARPRGAAARRVLPLLGSGDAGRARNGAPTQDGHRPGDRARPPIPVRSPVIDPRRDHRAPVEDQGAGDLQFGPDQLLGVRDRGNPPSADLRRRWSALPQPADGHRSRDPACRRLLLLSPDRVRLSVGRRRLRSGAAEPSIHRRAWSLPERCYSTTS